VILDLPSIHLTIKSLFVRHGNAYFWDGIQKKRQCETKTSDERDFNRESSCEVHTEHIFSRTLTWIPGSFATVIHLTFWLCSSRLHYTSPRGSLSGDNLMDPQPLTQQRNGFLWQIHFFISSDGFTVLYAAATAAALACHCW
jgi:hypothetical protein